MEKELEEAKVEIEKLKRSLDDKDSVIEQLSTTNAAQRDESESLKALVSELQKTCSGAEKDVESPKSNRYEGGDLLEEMEDKKRKVEEELKWKVEQFKHLEEAHEKLRDQFRMSKSEWETEKSLLVDEISKLQESLDDGNRTAAAVGLKNQLELCKQALENEETRRKKLEKQVSEMKLQMESHGMNEGFEVKMGAECSAAETGEDEVASLKHELRVKEMDYKDLEYKMKKLEKDNQELLASVKELQEAHIPRAVATPSAWAKLKGRLKSLEQSHKECSTNLKVKEAELLSRTERMTRDLEQCNSNMKMKDQIIGELRRELEGCNSSLTQLKRQNEEMSLMLQLMRSEGSEEKEGGLAHLMEQLEKEREEKLALHEELDRVRDELEEAREALDMIDSELTDKSNEKCELELEMQNWISIVAHLEKQMTGSQSMRRELEMSLLAQAEIEEMLKLESEDKERRIGNLEQQIYLMDQEIRIEEEDPAEVDEKVSQRLQMDDGEQLQLELLARELEEAIVAHIMGEKNYAFEQSLHEDMEPAQEHQNMNQGMNNSQTAMDQNMNHGSINNQTVMDPEGEEVCASKENENQQHSHLRKTDESIIEERSPFRELN